MREVGGYAGDVSPAINDGTIIGPHVYSSITPISMTAGHGDLHFLPIQTVLDACANGFPRAVCDGVDDCIKTVRLMLCRGAKVIKICATGGIFSFVDDPEQRQFSDAELIAMVEEATRAKRAVTAHCHGKDGIIAALNAGCKTIEHGSYLDEEVAELFKEKSAILVATRTVIESSLKMKDLIKPGPRAKLEYIAESHKKAYRLAIKSGIKIALGTDIGVSEPDTPLSHCKNGQELVYAIQAGMTPLQAIEACTETAPETLGPQAPLSGLLKEGYDADLIRLFENPLDDITVLSDADNVKFVWKGGKLYKSPQYESSWDFV